MIEQMLRLSTAHLTKRTQDSLMVAHLDWDGCIPFGTNTEHRPIEGIAADRIGDYGWLINIDNDMRDCHTTRAYLASELLPIIDKAAENGCDWVMFDDDGPTIIGLQTFDD